MLRKEPPDHRWWHKGTWKRGREVTVTACDEKRTGLCPELPFTPVPPKLVHPFCHEAETCRVNLLLKYPRKCQGQFTQRESTQGKSTQGESTQRESTRGESTRGESTQGESTQGQSTQSSRRRGWVETTCPSRNLLAPSGPGPHSGHHGPGCQEPSRDSALTRVKSKPLAGLKCPWLLPL